MPLDLAALGVDALVVSALPNVRYLTGFTGSNGVALVEPHRTTLFTDPRYTEQAAQEANCPARTVKRGALILAVRKVLDRARVRRVGFERNRASFAEHAALSEKLPRRSTLVALDYAVENLRMVKTPDEIAKIRASVEINSRAFDRALGRFQPSMTELDLAAEIDYQMRLAGAEGPAFDTIVASGARAALPHAHPTRAKIGTNRLLLIDAGAMVEGYASDMTRTVAVGRIPEPLKRMYEAVREAQLAAIDAVRPGVSSRSVDRRARQTLKAHGMDREFVHSTGHGLGLEIHEPPRLGRGENVKLVAGMAITIEPGVYRREVGGVRIEDTVAVTASGCETLTPTTKDLLSI
jgi:Xaa-Pro aminopeptidase